MATQLSKLRKHKKTNVFNFANIGLKFDVVAESYPQHILQALHIAVFFINILALTNLSVSKISHKALNGF